MKETILSIDMGSSKIATIIATHQNKNMDIVGISIGKNKLSKENLALDFENHQDSIKDLINDATNNLSLNINKTIIALNNKDIVNVKNSGKIDLPDKIVTKDIINQALQMAALNVSIAPEYEIIQVIPKNYTIDGIHINNPLNENAKKLEVYTNIFLAKKETINKFKKLNFTNPIFVSSAYATALAISNEEQRKNGVIILDMGAVTSQIICFKENEYIYNDFLPLGSNLITDDLALNLDIPFDMAENLKLKVSNSLKIDEDIDLATVQKIINEKLKVIFTLLKRRLEKNINISDFQSGILITGGLANLISVKEIATDIFQDLPIVLSLPNNIENKFINLQEHNLSCCIGLVNYARFQENKFELDSNKKIVYFNHTKYSNNSTKRNKRELPTFMKRLLEHF
jgi:cell division protein FtsA